MNPDGSTTPTTTIDPETGETVPIVTHLCPHNEAFLADPNYEAIYQQQLQEILARSAPPPEAPPEETPAQ